MKIFCSGIGGIGLSAYAALQRARGHSVSGSDQTESPVTADLRLQGIDVIVEQDGRHVSRDCDLFVYSEAIPEDAAERRRAAELGIRMESYPQAVSSLTHRKKLIAIAGTHGKSSTTAMVARFLVQSGRDPTVIVGTKMQELSDRNWRLGNGDLFVLEACEYRRSFLQYHPAIVLMTTCDGDHFDYYTSAADYRNAFVEFLGNMPNDGTLITHMRDPDCAAVAQASGASVIDADTFALPVLQTPGKHMQENAQLVLALATCLGIDEKSARQSLVGYRGSWRRMEERGATAVGVPVIDDYGHHPREIIATISALREAHPGRRFVCVFQPHTHDRTLKLYDDFTRAFAGVDVLIVADVYGARAESGQKVDLPTFIRDIAGGSHILAIPGGTLAEAESTLRDRILQKGDLLLCLGAGDITNLATAMLSS